MRFDEKKRIKIWKKNIFLFYTKKTSFSCLFNKKKIPNNIDFRYIVNRPWADRGKVLRKMGKGKKTMKCKLVDHLFVIGFMVCLFFLDFWETF